MPEKDEEKTAPVKAAASAPAAERKPAKESSGELRTGALEVDADNPSIDPRLDNRTGDQRPKLEEFPAKPQQIDGPEIGEEKEHAKRVARQDRGEVGGPRKGAKSPGPHGLGDTGDGV